MNVERGSMSLRSQEQEYKPIGQLDVDLDEKEAVVGEERAFPEDFEKDKDRTLDDVDAVLTNISKRRSLILLPFLTGFLVGFHGLFTTDPTAANTDPTASLPLNDDGITPMTSTPPTITTTTTTPEAPPLSAAFHSKNTTAILEQQLIKCHTDPNEKCFMYSMKDSGLGSQLINMFVDELYLTNELGYTTMLVDNSAYEGYRRIDGEPVLTGYFTPQIAVFNYPSFNSTRAEQDLLDPYLPDGFDLTEYNRMDVIARKRVKKIVNAHAADVTVVSLMMFHGAARNWVKNGLPQGYHDLYRTLVHRMCPNLQFNPAAWADIQALRQQNYPQLQLWLQQQQEPAPRTTEGAAAPISVAFHIRRTDKVQGQGESAAYPAASYIQQLTQALTLDFRALADVEVCFLATDDLTVDKEFQAALDEAGVPCQLFMTPPSPSSPGVSSGDPERRYKAQSGLVFLTELSVMLETTYLVGTFGSNVDALAAVLRACPGRNQDPENHYANTYGVDRANWYFR
mmetsp:Transcript_17512/g.35237  ORF Transcript_17512/g.35237 Transcript_17512/m.35237 type:complete len:511 (+) Transcript_17512:122-1654(+)|eukprot:scaffold34603_cov212-Amphora_coffeaeformis.AAC.21